MAREPDLQALQTRLAELESENVELSAQLGAVSSGAAPRQHWRGALAVVLIVLGALLAPVAIVSSWSRVVLSDTEAVVATLAPLAKDPQLQDYIAGQVNAAIEESFDIDAMVDQVFSGLTEALPDRPLVQTGLDALRRIAADGVRSAIDAAVTRVVTADAFAEVWRRSLELSHAQATALLEGDPDAMLAIADDGLALRLGPVIERVRDTLVEEGYSLFALVPEVDRTIVLVPTQSLVKVQLAYRSALVAGHWLGLVSALLLAGGVLVSRRRARALVWAAVGLGLGALVVVVGVALGRIVAQINVPPAVMPTALVVTLYDASAAALAELGVAALLLAVVVGGSAWLFGPFAPARKLRSSYGAGVERIRQNAEERGHNTGAFGEWVYRFRVQLWAGIAALAVTLILFNRPISTALIIWVALGAAVLLFTISLVGRPAAGQEPASPAAPAESN